MTDDEKRHREQKNSERRHNKRRRDEGKQFIPLEDSETSESMESMAVLKLPFSVEEREVLGYRTKVMLDVGRLLYLETKGYTCSMVDYVDSSVTKENRLLIAKKSCTAAAVAVE